MSSHSRVLELIRAADAVQGLGVRGYAAKGDLSHGTISNYLAGKIPEALNDSRLEKISRAFSIPLPRLRAAHLADRGLALAEPEEPTISPEDRVLDAIRADTRLLPEAREHLINQYGLLLRLRAQVVQDEVSKRRQQLRDGDDGPPTD